MTRVSIFGLFGTPSAVFATNYLELVSRTIFSGKHDCRDRETARFFPKKSFCIYDEPPLDSKVVAMFSTFRNTFR